MCSNGRSTRDITDIESLLLDKKDDINLVNDNIETYKDFTNELYEYYKLNHGKIKESAFRKKFTKKMAHINKGVKGFSREKNKKGNYKKVGLTVKKTYLIYVYQKMIVDTIVDGIAPLAIALEVFTKLMGLLVTRNLLVYV